MDKCIFCKIAKNEVPAYKVYEDEKSIAFLDIFPASKGQTLIIPKKHETYIFNFDKKLYDHLFDIAKKIAKGIDASLQPLRTCIVVEGFAVDHVHIRLHPCYEKHLNLQPLKNKPSESELKEIAKKIKTLLK